MISRTSPNTAQDRPEVLELIATIFVSNVRFGHIYSYLANTIKLGVKIKSILYITVWVCACAIRARHANGSWRMEATVVVTAV